jgi:transketolase
MLDFQLRSRSIRKKIVKKAFECGETTHLGGALSMVDILCILYGSFLNYDVNNLQSDDRDVFILSKGHCALSWFATLNEYGLMKDIVFDTFQSNGSHLIAHPVKNLPLGIESSNGSLGQGLSFGIGMALGMRKKGQDRSVYVLMGDGECNEGSIWEAAATASEIGLSNLISIVDVNNLRNDGPNLTYQKNKSLPAIWAAFGWNVVEVDGHSEMELHDAFDTAKNESGMPTVILANTIKGCGVSFMEANNEWHHNRITASVYDRIQDEWLQDV